MFYKHLRKVREMKEGAELRAELNKLTSWIDEDPKLFTADILYNILLSYRDIQVLSIALPPSLSIYKLIIVLTPCPL